MSDEIEDREKITRDQVEAKIKNTRMLLDHLLILHSEFYTSRELALVKTHIQNGSMWLGRVLGFVGATYPYPESYNTGNSIIEERTDQAKDAAFELPSIPSDADRTIAVKWFREQLSGIISGLKDLHNHVIESFQDELEEGLDGLGQHYFLAIENLDLSNMWFGMELNRIFEDQKKRENAIEFSAKRAYDAYGKVTEYKNFQGNPMPEFDALPDKIKEAWSAVGKMIYGSGLNSEGFSPRF